MQKTFHVRALNQAAPQSTLQCGWDTDQLQWYCTSILRSVFPAFRKSHIEVRFYPYVGLTHTLRRKKSGWVLRISDHCRNAPSQVLESIVLILGYKVMRRKPPRRLLETYDRFRLNPAVDSAVRHRRQLKGRKQFSDNAGMHHSLHRLYGELNDLYFNGQIEINRIGWGRRKSWGRLGHYDPIHHTITLSPVLDSPSVPPFVVRYIVYHEMLHALFEDHSVRDSCKHHPREFRNTESAYPDYGRAKDFLRKFNKESRLEA